MCNVSTRSSSTPRTPLTPRQGLRRQLHQEKERYEGVLQELKVVNHERAAAHCAQEKLRKELEEARCELTSALTQRSDELAVAQAELRSKTASLEAMSSDLEFARAEVESLASSGDRTPPAAYTGKPQTAPVYMAGTSGRKLPPLPQRAKSAPVVRQQQRPTSAFVFKPKHRSRTDARTGPTQHAPRGRRPLPPVSRPSPAPSCSTGKPQSAPPKHARPPPRMPSQVVFVRPSPREKRVRAKPAALLEQPMWVF